ncbi:hypothetical protein, partial [Mycobacterium interjectum]|uniref:hypothetical protein n=1 Tax=Mycobacterium interjectum TaxID=33895 RepID=UPI0023DEA31D|nr:hypothetical protein [Mycobacterium interjectum]
MYVNGARVSTVDLHSGQAITIGDPQRGPRLVFQIGPPAAPPGRPDGAPPRPNDPNLQPPTERPTHAPCGPVAATASGATR